MHACICVYVHAYVYIYIYSDTSMHAYIHTRKFQLYIAIIEQGAFSLLSVRAQPCRRKICREDQWWLSTSKAKEALARDVPGVPLNNSPVRHWLQRIFAPSYGKFCSFLRFYWAAKLGYSDSEKYVADYASPFPDVKLP